MSARNGLGIALGVCVSCWTALANAGYSLYDEDGKKLDLNLMAAGAQFGQDQSWFGVSHQLLNASEDHWTEFGTEFGLSGEMPLGGGTLFAESSGIYTRTSGDDASGITAGLSEEEDTTLEQAHIGWRKSDVFAGLEDDTLTMQIGRFDYSIGTGMLINDGGSDGGHRGGWYLGLRKAFQNAAMVSLDSTTLKAQVFRLKNNPRSGGPQGEATGANVDYPFGENISVGATYMKVNPQGNQADADVYDGRASWTALPGLTFSGEYAREESNDFNGDGYYAQAVYELTETAWKPAFTYRYAEFDQNFNPLAYGYTDYGYWYQGEVAGNYPLYNNNLKSNMVRAKFEPYKAVTVNLFYYDFKLVDPAAYGVSSDDFGDEVDLVVDWAATERIYVIATFSVLNPGNAAEQLTGGNDDWKYAMLYVSYTL